MFNHTNLCIKKNWKKKVIKVYLLKVKSNSFHYPNTLFDRKYSWTDPIDSKGAHGMKEFDPCQGSLGLYFQNISKVDQAFYIAVKKIAQTD